MASVALHDNNLELWIWLIWLQYHGFTVGAPKPERRRYYMQPVITLNEGLAHGT